MRLNQLATFLAVVDAGSFTAASERLLISQPALSRQIAELERELAVPLLHRTAKGAHPTPAGIALQTHARRVLSLVSDTQAVVDAARNRAPVVRIGVAPGLPNDWLRSLLQHGRRDVPAVELLLIEATTEAQAARLDANDLDLGVTHRPPIGLHSTLILKQQLGLATNGEPIAPGQASVPFRLLDRRAVLSHSPEETSLHHDQLLFAGRQASIEPHWIFRQFSQYVDLAADLAGALGVVLVEPTATRLVPAWRWRPLVDPGIDVFTYLVRRRELDGPGTAVAESLARSAECLLGAPDALQAD